MISRHRAAASVLTLVVFALLLASFGGSGGIAGFGIGAEQEGRPAPEFPSLDAASWAGTPTSLASLRGRVVLINVWTFGCINCKRTLPWVASIHARFGTKGVTVLGVHTPELDFERDPRAVEEARRKHGLGFPSFIDARSVYWRALDNHYWPTVYLIDKKGIIRRVQVGEVHAGDGSATRLEQELAALLAEPPPPPSRNAAEK